MDVSMQFSSSLFVSMINHVSNTFQCKFNFKTNLSWDLNVQFLEKDDTKQQQLLLNTLAHNILKANKNHIWNLLKDNINQRSVNRQFKDKHIKN